MNEKQTVSVILAEDDDGHATLVERNLSKTITLNKFIRAKDGKDLIEILERDAEENKNSLLNNPLLLLLDLKMPRMGGIETLKKIKSNPEHAKIPAIMLTTSDNPQEIETCYKLGCAVYVTKPIIYEAFVETIRRLGLFLELVKFPCENKIPE